MVPGDASEGYMAALGDLTDNDKLTHIQWLTGNIMPELPPASATARAA
jgi:hypothetical protein